MALQESGEMYLENILVLKKRLGKVRSIDIAHYASLSKPSVSRAMSILKREALIQMDPDGYITLTETGEAIASRIYERHVFLSDFLTRIGVDPKIADKDACKIEHDLSEETFSQLKKFVAQWESKNTF